MMVRKIIATTLLQVSQWWAFFHALLILTFFPMVILTSKRGMFEEGPSLYEQFVSFYGGFLALVPGGEIVWGLALSPMIWIILWITTGKPRFLPWKK